jgi:Spy/CpxP family protein refolding chaperone
MKLLRTCLTAALALVIGSAMAAAQDKKGKAEKGPAPSAVDRLGRFMERMSTLGQAVQKMSLTDEQKTKITGLRQEIGPKLKEIMESMEGVLTDEQKQARTEAVEKANAAGKRGLEMMKAVQAAMKLTDEQQKKLEEPVKKLGELQSEFVKKIMGVLTEEQRADLKKALGGDGKKPAKAAAKAKE